MIEFRSYPLFGVAGESPESSPENIAAAVAARRTHRCVALAILYNVRIEHFFKILRRNLAGKVRRKIFVNFANHRVALDAYNNVPKDQK